MSSLMVLVALALGGVVAVVLAWRGSADKVNVAEQLPYVVSGGFGGLGMLGFALGVLCIQQRRWAEARRRARFDRMVRAAAELVVTAQEQSRSSRR